MFAITKALQLGPLTKKEEFLPTDHPLFKTSNVLRKEFSRRDSSVIPVKVFFGVKYINKDKVGKWDPADLGEVVFDDDLDISSKEA